MLLRMKKRLQSNRHAISAVLCVALVYAGMFAVGITCPIKHLTGISCPGCGMSRAWLHALTLDFAGAFAFHPLFWLLPPGILLFFLQKKHRAAQIALYALILLAIVVYGFRMANASDTVVIFAPQEGLFCRIVQAIRSASGL